MKTLYDVLRVRRNASNDAIRTAFRKAAKAYHPDLNAGDPLAEQQLRHVIAAYELLRNPQKRMAYDRYLRTTRRESVRNFAMAAAIALVSSSAVVGLTVSLSNVQIASGPQPAPVAVAAAMVSQPAGQQVADADGIRQEADRSSKRDRMVTASVTAALPQQPAGGQAAAARQPEPRARSAREQAISDAPAIQAFAARNPDARESELTRSRLIALIDSAEDVALLQMLRLGGSDAIAERAQQRLVRLAARTRAKEERANSYAAALEHRVADFVSERVSSWSSTSAVDLAAITGVYADKVRYYGKLKSRQAVLLEKSRLLEDWPERVYAVQPGSITVQCRGNMCKAGGTMIWQTRNVARATSASGIAHFAYEIALSRDGTFSILSENAAATKRPGQEEKQGESRSTKAAAAQHKQGAGR